MLKKELEAKVKEQEQEIKRLKGGQTADRTDRGSAQRARVMEALLKYVSYHWLADVDAVSVAAKEARRKVRGNKARRILQNLERRFPADGEGYLNRLWDEGVSLPLDKEMLQILGEGIVVDIEEGRNGLMLTVKRTEVPLEDKVDLTDDAPEN